MANNRKKANSGEMSAVVSLSIKPRATPRERAEFASEVCERFLRAAALLPGQEFLGWQINTETDGKHHTFAFSSAGAKAAPEDYSWIFQMCATVGEAPQGFLNDLHEGSRWVYALQYAKKESERESSAIYRGLSAYSDDEYDDYSDYTVSGKYFRNLFEETGNSKAVLRVLAMPGADDARGIFLVSLPGEMTLRMRAMISLAFPDTVAVRVKAADALPDSTNRIPLRCLADGVMGLLDALMAGHPDKDIQKERRAEEELQLSDDPEAETSGQTGITPLEDLELSIRAYNCLKRAGVNTVEQLRTMTDEDLLSVRNLGRKFIEEIKYKLSETARLSAPLPRTASSCTDMLEELIGLDRVKEQVRKIAAFAKLRHDMAKLNKAPVPIVLNMEFTGNPGTAKTTVARIMAGIFYEMGLLPCNELVEVGRADLVARYEGQTADKVKSLFRRARGKVLFIDEAYSLVEGLDGSFGDEAINTIVQEMENNRGDTVVIFAGYPNEMEAFFARNPGLRSRVPFHIAFEDYSADEMVQITELEAKKRGFSIRPRARERIASICEAAAGRSDLGNGRFCRNLVESAILGYAARVYKGSNEAAAQDFVLEDKDFSLPEVSRKLKKSAAIGFRV